MDESLQEIARLRAGTYGILSLVTRAPPDKELIHKLMEHISKDDYENYMKAMETRGIYSGIKKGISLVTRFMNNHGNNIDEELVKKLSAMYTKIFRGLKEEKSPPPPYESVYREGILMGKSTYIVLSRYRSEGLEPDTNEPPDSLWLELEFMRYLCTKEYEAYGRGGYSLVKNIWRKQLEFLENHILQWVPNFTDIAIKYCREYGEEADFYLGFLTILKSFINIDREYLVAMTKDHE